MDSTRTKRESPGPAPDANSEDPHGPEFEHSNQKSKRFRFKAKHRSGRDGHSHHHNHSHRRHRQHRHHRHRHDGSSSKRRKTRHSRSPSPYSLHEPRMSPDSVFRESLFDALGDDEGAMYWESVYGQPVHTYSIPSVPKGPDGELEQMSDEEYAAYVRARMWERTHEGLMEERERLGAEKARHKEEQQRRQREGRERTMFDLAVEDSLRRGRERRRVKAWSVIWMDYRRSWDELNRLVSADRDGEHQENDNKDTKRLRNVLFWPVESGKRKDVSREAVEEFIRHAPRDDDIAKRDRTDGIPSDLLTTIKSERVRWHPDKIQHRYGALGIDDVVLQSVTEVFQIIDHMWNKEREKQG